MGVTLAHVTAITLPILSSSHGSYMPTSGKPCVGSPLGRGDIIGANATRLSKSIFVTHTHTYTCIHLSLSVTVISWTVCVGMMRDLAFRIRNQNDANRYRVIDSVSRHRHRRTHTQTHTQTHARTITNRHLRHKLTYRHVETPTNTCTHTHPSVRLHTYIHKHARKT